MTTLDDLAAAAEKARPDYEACLGSRETALEGHGVRLDPTTVLRLVAVARAGLAFSNAKPGYDRRVAANEFRAALAALEEVR